MIAKPDFTPAADGVIYAPPESLTDLPVVSVRPNRAKKRAPGEEWMTDEYKLFAGHDGLLVRTMLVRSSSYREQKDIVTISSPTDIVCLCAHMRFLDQEHIVVLSMNSTNEVAAIYEAAKGPPDHAAVIAIDILKVPILTGCRGFIIIHNHPGGSPIPSEADKHLTTKVAASSECIGLTLLDHVIIGRHGSFSFQERGLL